MEIPLPFHLFIHFYLAVLVGYIIGRRYKNIRLGIIGGIIGGFLIDLDHILEYLMVFGGNFSFTYFFQGRQFLVSDKIHTLFHAWEYIPVFLIAAYLFRRRVLVFAFILAVSLAGAVHLVTDCIINNYPPRNYSIIYRIDHGFSAPSMLNDEQYQRYIEDRYWLGL